jgi:hypothetical protein
MTSSRKTKAALQAAPDLHAQLGLRPGQSIELLKELHILTRDGRLNQDSRRKLKQVNHLLQFIEKVRQELPPREGGLLLADHGADVVTALHACDTATDDAIAFALRKQARAIVLAPCCQAEVAARLRMNKALQLARTPLAELWRHPLHTREMGSQLTNVLRCLYLESQGYAVTVTELVGWEHSMKNELIIAMWTGHKKRSAAERLQALLAQFGLEALLAERFPALRV